MKQNRKMVLLKLRQPGSLLFAYFFFSAICGFFVFMSLFRTQDPLLTGLSAEKVLFFTTIILLTLILLISAFYFLARKDHAQIVGDFIFKDVKHRIFLLRVAGVGFVLCWMGYFFPSYLILPPASAYLFWIKPILSWAAWCFIAIILVVQLEAIDYPVKLTFFFRKTLFRAVCAAFLFFVVVFVFMVNTDLGISVQEDYWYGPGVPVLWIQIFAALLITLLISWVLNHVRSFKNTSKVDIIIFLLLWLITAYVWGREPLQPSHFMPDTAVNAIYPYSDSATFDMGAQYALIGQGLFNGQYFDRSLYSAFLTYLHVIAGQDTVILMVFQSIIYAVFPAILYLLGREFHGRTLGISLGFLIMFRGINSIFGASVIDLAGPKMMLTDFPTAIGVALIMFFIVKWMKAPAQASNIIWAGCFIGLTLLLRTHVILLLPFLIAYIVLYFRNNRKLWLYGTIFLILGMIISTLPLDFQNQKKGVPLFYMYYSRIQDVLKARYGTSDSPNTYHSDKSRTSSSTLGRERLIIYKYQKAGCSTKLCAIGNHFFHNLAGTVLSLPASFVFDDFRHTVREAAPYWGKDWIGEDVDAENYLLLFINLTVTSAGIGMIWARRSLPGLFPLGIYFVYILSNSLAFTSGGRYLAPVDWIIYIYYVMGILGIFFWLLRHTGFDFQIDSQNDEIRPDSKALSAISFRNVFISFAAVFMLGSLIPFADSLFSRRYDEKESRDILLTLTEGRLLEEANLTEASVAEFLIDPNARLILGRALYPRFYPSGKGEPGLDYPYTALGYRRLVFMVIGPFSPAANGVILPIENLHSDLHASDVIVLGCATDNFLDAAVVFVLSEPAQVYTRSTDLALQCPFPNP